MRTEIGKTLVRLCKERRLSVANLAEQSGVSRNTINGWISQGKEPSLGQLKKVCEVLGVSVHRLAFGCPDPNEKVGEEILKELFSGDVRVTLHRIERKKIGINE